MATAIGEENGSGRAGSRSIPTVTFEQLEADPHGVFRQFRKDHAVVMHENGAYFVLRFADVERLGKDARVRPSGTAFPQSLGISSGAIFDMFEYGMLTADGDVHRRRRAPFSRLFTVRTITEMRPSIRRTAENLIDGWYGNGEVDFLNEFAAQIPAHIIADLLGLPRDDIPEFTKLVYQVIRIFSVSLSPYEVEAIGKAAQRLREYIEEILDQRRRSPRDDFLSAFLAAATGEMSPEEMLFQIFLLIAGGTDTTRGAIAMQVALLLQHREQWAEVCYKPALVPSAVAEALRFEPNAAALVRATGEDVEVDGATIPAGQLVMLSTMSALRDENVYDNPDVFDIHRSKQPRLHPIFGYGAHRCIGEALARAELEESLSAITCRIPQLQLDKPPRITGHFGFRPIDGMRVSWKS